MRPGAAAVGCAILAALACAHPSHALLSGEDTARHDLRTLVELATHGVPPTFLGPSPGALARRLLAAGEARVRPDLERAWALASVEGSGAGGRVSALRAVVRFLFGVEGPVPQRPGGWDPASAYLGERGGLVLLRRRRDALGGGGNGSPPGDAIATGPLADLVRGGHWRVLPAVSHPALLRLLDEGIPAKEGWTEDETSCLHLALGEACAGDREALSDLRRRIQEAAEAGPLARAVATAGDPECTRDLCARIPPWLGTASRDIAPRDSLRWACSAACEGDPEGFLKMTDALPWRERRLALLALGFKGATRLLIDRALSDRDPVGRREALLVLSRLAGDGVSLWDSPADEDFPRLIGAWRRAAGGSDRELARCAMGGAVFSLWGGLVSGSDEGGSFGDGITCSIRGWRLGPYPDPVEALRSIEEDLAAGLRPRNDAASADIFAEPLGEPRGFESEAHRAWCGVPSPNPESGLARAESGIHIGVRETPDGLRLELVNAGTSPFCLDTMALRHPFATRCRAQVSGEKGGPRSFAYLRVEYGSLPGRWSVPVGACRVVRPGETFSWPLSLRPVDRDLPHIAITLQDESAVEGPIGAPLLRRLEESWIR